MIALIRLISAKKMLPSEAILECFCAGVGKRKGREAKRWGRKGVNGSVFADFLESGEASWQATVRAVWQAVLQAGSRHSNKNARRFAVGRKQRGENCALLLRTPVGAPLFAVVHNPVDCGAFVADIVPRLFGFKPLML